jgi:hypothetical protein
MTQTVSELVRLAFPVEPIPDKYFWSGEIDRVGDFTQDFLENIARRPWTDISTADWRNSLLTGGSFRNYVEPSTFLYYIPSLIVDALKGNRDDIQTALEEILPFNSDRNPRGKWWDEFSESISAKQRLVLSAFLIYRRKECWNQLDLEIQLLICSAESIWLETS